jgi:hypothetical protein
MEDWKCWHHESEKLLDDMEWRRGRMTDSGYGIPGVGGIVPG